MSERVRGFAAWTPRANSRAVLGQVHQVLDEYRAHLPLTVRQIFYRLVGGYGVPVSSCGEFDSLTFSTTPPSGSPAARCPRWCYTSATTTPAELRCWRPPPPTLRPWSTSWAVR